MEDRKKLAMLGISILSAVLVIGGTIFYFGNKTDAPVEETAIVQETDIEVEEEIVEQEEVVDWQLVRVEGVRLKTTSDTVLRSKPKDDAEVLTQVAKDLVFDEDFVVFDMENNATGYSQITVDGISGYIKDYEYVVEDMTEAIEGVSEDSTIEVQQEEVKETADIEPEPEVQEPEVAPEVAQEVASEVSPEPQDPVVPEPEPVVEPEPAPSPAPAPATPNVEVKTEQQVQSDIDSSVADDLAALGISAEQYSDWQNSINYNSNVESSYSGSVISSDNFSFY